MKRYVSILYIVLISALVCDRETYIISQIGHTHWRRLRQRFGGDEVGASASKVFCRALRNVKFGDGGGLTVFVNFNI